jgi:hypothetical protein
LRRQLKDTELTLLGRALRMGEFNPGTIHMGIHHQE